MIAQMHKYFNERNAWLVGVGNMGFYIALCLGCYILGIGVIGVSFYVQHLENLHRPKGYHLKATVKKNYRIGITAKENCSFGSFYSANSSPVLLWLP